MGATASLRCSITQFLSNLVREMSGSGCVLSMQASALSSALTALIGSIVNGLTSGWLVAFMTGWFTLFAMLRVLIGGTYMLYRSTCSSWVPKDDTEDAELLSRGNQVEHEGAYSGEIDAANLPQPGSRTFASPSGTYQPLYIEISQGYSTALPPRGHWPNDYSRRPPRRQVPWFFQNPGQNPWMEPTTGKSIPRIFWPSIADVRRAGSSLNREVTVFGWIGWVYGAVYAPITQIIWVAANASNPKGAPKLVKGFSVAVTALPLCIDCRTRYADALRTKRLGGMWAYIAFNTVNSVSCVVQGAISATLLAWGAIQVNADSQLPLPILAIYPIFSLVWAYVSFRLMPIRDGGRRRAAEKHSAGYFLDVGVGAFAGIFLAFPAFALYMGSKSLGDDGDDNASLGQYFSCETQSWRKFSAIFP